MYMEVVSIWQSQGTFLAHLDSLFLKEMFFSKQCQYLCILNFLPKFIKVMCVI